MVAPNSGSDEQIRYDILIEAQQAIKAMQTIMRATEDNTQKMKIFSEVVLASSKMWQTSWQQALNVYRQLNAELSNKKQANLFGKTGGQDLFSSTEKYLTSLDQAGRLQDNVSKSAKGMGDSMQNAFSTGIKGFSALRVAAGILISMLASQAIQAVSNFFKEAIDQAKQFEATLYRLANAERQLSMEGIEVSLKGLKEGIDDIKSALPIFSKEDISELVGSLATTTKELGLNEEQILKLGAAISILNVNSTETESLLQTQAKVTNSLISPQAKSIGSLGLAFGQAKIEAKAFEMQILKTGQSFKDLTEAQKTQIKYQIVLDTAGIGNIKDVSELKDLIANSGGEFDAINKFLESDTARIQENQAAWKDLQTTIGQIIIPFAPALTEFFNILNGGFIVLKITIIEVMTLFSGFASVFIALQTGMINSVGDFTNVLKTSIETTRNELTNRFFKEVPKDAPDWFMRGWGDRIKEQAETATGPIEDLGGAFGDTLEEMDDFGNKIEEIIEDTQNAIEDLDTELQRKKDDLDTEYQRKAEDAATDYARKVEDINRESADEINDIKEKHRQEDEEREAKYQLALWELQQKYLMDLEDALHNRDARQIIRLQRQYEFEKEALKRKHDLENKKDDADEAGEIKDVKNKTREKLEKARIEYERELADQQLAKQRELDDLNLWHERELADIQTAQQRKLEALIKGWIDEGKITQENAQMIYDILAGYFGPGGLTDQLYAYMMASLANTTAMLPAGMPDTYSNLAAQNGSAGVQAGMNLAPVWGAGEKFAEGGTLLATKPTTVTFGEVPEVVSFKPLGGGNNEDRMFGDTGAVGGGKMEIGVTLSPDLEARVIRKSLDANAEMILKVDRMQV